MNLNLNWESHASAEGWTVDRLPTAEDALNGFSNTNYPESCKDLVQIHCSHVTHERLPRGYSHSGNALCPWYQIVPRQPWAPLNRYTYSFGGRYGPLSTTAQINMTKFSPAEIEVLLHCYYSPEIHPRIDTPCVKSGLANLEMCGLIEPQVYMPGIDTTNLSTHRTTERGSAHIKQLCSLPLPKLVWANQNGIVIE